MSEVLTFGFDNEEIKGGLYEKYKGKKGETHRIGILYSDPKAIFAGGRTHYKERFFFCKKGKCCEVCGPAKWRVGSAIIKYATEKNGTIKKPLEYSIIPWICNESTYVKLKNIHSEFPLTTHDIKISCTNEEYQHLDLTPCNESIWTAKEEFKNKILEEAKPVWEFVKKSIAGDLSIEEINELLGVSTPGSPVTGMDPSSAVDLDSVLSKI